MNQVTQPSDQAIIFILVLIVIGLPSILFYYYYQKEKSTPKALLKMFLAISTGPLQWVYYLSVSLPSRIIDKLFGKKISSIYKRIAIFIYNIILLSVGIYFFLK